ncbi:MAG: efflux RND transporter periplasmic adaptor subunit [Candidatus Omnitrophica bacterium]|nr:efflux RND transporter periplasmic adaptor subunit [Candidatus Omnitrophota bacterium]
MMKLLFNMIAFSLITCGAVYSFYSIQSNHEIAQSNAHAGHAHAQNPDENEAGSHAEHDFEQHANELESANEIFIPPSERDPKRLWCNEHSVYEDECVICHPEIANKQFDHSGEKANPYSGHDHESAAGEHVELDSHAEHGPEGYADEQLENTGDLHAGHDHESVGHIETAEGLFCAEHRVLEEQCGICQPQLAGHLRPGESMKVRLPSVQSAAMAGIQTGKPIEGNTDSQFEFLCEINFNESRVAHISPLANGVIQKVHIDYGDMVTEGQVLLETASTEIAKAKSDYFKAIDQERLKRITFEREKELKDKNISARQDFQQAEAEYQVAQAERMTAHQQLMNYGLSEEEIELISAKRSTSSTLKLRAPFSGAVIEKHAVLGEAAAAGDALLKIADLTTMWLTLTIPESQISSVQINDSIIAEFSNLPGVSVQGEINWISPQVNKNTRMIQARALVNNVEGKLRHGFYGKARLVEQNAESQLLVPRDSVQQIDGKPFVFVKQENDLFELRRITPGRKSSHQIEILSGLNPNDEIVVASSFSLKSEFLKSRFGAGCAHD